MNYQNKGNLRYLKANLSPKQFRLVRITPYILAFLVLGNFIYKNLQMRQINLFLKNMIIARGSLIIMIRKPTNYSLGKLVGYSSLITKSLKGPIKTVNCMVCLKYGMKMETLQKKLSMKKEYLFLKPHGMRTE